jgi:chromosome segregation ATPase
VDSDDPLEAGLEIFAQPPGKRLQSLTLLSGGEQALTAVALIFALFLTNPAPICVLDEVDAPLDDANVERFCDMLDAMVGETDTRYLIVTHNAVTMSRMHRLFGVTMVEKASRGWSAWTLAPPRNCWRRRSGVDKFGHGRSDSYPAFSRNQPARIRRGCEHSM